MGVKFTNEINPKKFEIGQLVYFTNNIGSEMDWGIIEDLYSDGYGIALYEAADCRTVEGTPIADYDFHQKPRKLPKGWSYKDDLIKLGLDNHKFEGFKFSYDDPNSLMKGIEIGAFVRPDSQNKACVINTKITNDGYRIICEHELWFSKKRPNYAIVNWPYIYSTYDEAKNVVDAYNAELNRQASLSDYDWSLEQIDKALDRAIFIEKEDKAKVRQWLIDNTNIEDVDIKSVEGYVKWKYTHNKKWKVLDPSLL